jgi:hypothetical protein
MVPPGAGQGSFGLLDRHLLYGAGEADCFVSSLVINTHLSVTSEPRSLGHSQVGCFAAQVPHVKSLERHYTWTCPGFWHLLHNFERASLT